MACVAVEGCRSIHQWRWKARPRWVSCRRRPCTPRACYVRRAPTSSTDLLQSLALVSHTVSHEQTMMNAWSGVGSSLHLDWIPTCNADYAMHLISTYGGSPRVLIAHAFVLWLCLRGCCDYWRNHLGQVLGVARGHPTQTGHSEHDCTHLVVWQLALRSHILRTWLIPYIIVTLA